MPCLIINNTMKRFVLHYHKTDVWEMNVFENSNEMDSITNSALLKHGGGHNTEWTCYVNLEFCKSNAFVRDAIVSIFNGIEHLFICPKLNRLYLPIMRIVHPKNSKQSHTNIIELYNDLCFTDRFNVIYLSVVYAFCVSCSFVLLMNDLRNIPNI